MPQWDYSINIKRFLTEDEVTETIARNVVNELKKVPVFCDEDNYEAQDALYDLIDAGKEGDTRQFNAVLDEIYTIADEHRVWLGI